MLNVVRRNFLLIFFLALDIMFNPKYAIEITKLAKEIKEL